MTPDLYELARLVARVPGRMLGRVARDLAAAGVPVFPCVPRAKRPLTSHGFHDATTDPVQVERWWGRWPEANLGLPTGAVPGVVVVGVDIHDRVDGRTALARAVEAGRVGVPVFTVVSPSGGRHGYYPATTGVVLQPQWLLSPSTPLDPRVAARINPSESQERHDDHIRPHQQPDQPTPTRSPGRVLPAGLHPQVAHKGGTDEGFSIPAQRDDVHRKAKQLGATIIEEFVDASVSAKSADRLARNRADDITIHLALQQAGVLLVSATENIDETPSGRLLHNIMSTIAEFYSRNLATEVAKDMTQKAINGGTNNKTPSTTATSNSATTKDARTAPSNSTPTGHP